MENIEEIMEQKKEDERFKQWRDEINKDIPNLASRVFNLRNKFYMGCGFHYSLEYDLGRIISGLNNINEIYSCDKHKCMISRIGLEVAVELLYEYVKKAEESIK